MDQDYNPQNSEGKKRRARQSSPPTVKGVVVTPSNAANKKELNSPRVRLAKAINDIFKEAGATNFGIGLSEAEANADYIRKNLPKKKKR